MRIGIQAWGSEGDIRPFLALGHALVRAGHRVTVVVTDLGARDYAAYQERLGLRIRTVATPVVPDPAELDDIGRAILRAGHPARQSRIIIERLFDPAVPEMYRAATALCAESDLVVGHFFQTPLRAAAEAAGIPEVSVTLTPSMIPTGAMPPEGVPDLGRRWNRMWWGVAGWVLDRMFLSRINRFRDEAGLPPHTHVLDAWSSRLLDLVAVTPTLCPVPEDWPEQHRVCGFLTLPPDGQLDASPPALEAFLDEGDPPAFITFGSLTPSDEAERYDALRIFTEAVSRAGCRAIVQGFAGVDQPIREGDVLHVGRVPHPRVFPRCSVVVHHGGAGTTQTVLSTGVPSVVVPHVADQFFWGDTLRRFGVAAPPLPRRKMTAAALAGRIRRVVGNQPVLERARRVAGSMAAEDGCVTAVELVEGVLRRIRGGTGTAAD